MSNLFLKPAPGADGNPVLVRDPVTRKPLDAAGEWKEASYFWLHRIRDKDVFETTPAAPADAPAAPDVTAKPKSSGEIAPVSFAAKRD